MQYQRVTRGKPTVSGPPCPAKTENAVAGVKARNGADRKAPSKKPGAQNTAARPTLTSALVAVLDRNGMVCGVFAGRGAARSFLQGGHA